MEAVDEYIPESVRQLDKSFFMPIEDVFSVPRHGTVFIGRVEQGTIKTGEEVEIFGKSFQDIVESKVTGIQVFKKRLKFCQAGDFVGLFLRGVNELEMLRRMGLIIYKPGDFPVKMYKRFEAEIYVFTKDEGGRDTVFFSDYQFYFCMFHNSAFVRVELPENVKMVMPGDNVTAVFKLVLHAPLETGQRFALEGKFTVATGVITKILG